MANFVYRIQPAGAELHGVQTETSNGTLANGVHVFETWAELAAAVSGWGYGPGAVEIAAVRCNAGDVIPNGDFEGSLLRRGRGVIVSRKRFQSFAQLAKSVVK